MYGFSETEVLGKEFKNFVSLAPDSDDFPSAVFDIYYR